MSVVRVQLELVPDSGEEVGVKGYRVRLRVVEEHEVALYAESEDDAKLRAETAIRSDGQEQQLEDTWPERIISIEPLAVERYADLDG
jgi:hypothetical protein